MKPSPNIAEMFLSFSHMGTPASLSLLRSMHSISNMITNVAPVLVKKSDKDRPEPAVGHFIKYPKKNKHDHHKSISIVHNIVPAYSLWCKKSTHDTRISIGLAISQLLQKTYSLTGIIKWHLRPTSTRTYTNLRVLSCGFLWLAGILTIPKLSKIEFLPRSTWLYNKIKHCPLPESAPALEICSLLAWSVFSSCPTKKQ